MADYLNDSPISYFSDDSYGIGPFAKALARNILKIGKPVGTTVALNGAWGSGKSSVVNLVKRELVNANDDRLVVSDFQCWWFRGEEALALAFMQELYANFRNKLGKGDKDIVPKIARTLLQAGSVVGPTIAAATGSPWWALFKLSNFASKFFPDGQSVEEQFVKLAKALEDQSYRFLIIIDDIDRLDPQEAMAIFRMVKSVGRLPNVMYLLVYDRELADRIVKELHPSEGPHFLEKIVQVAFEVPMPLQSDLNSAVLSSIEQICGRPEEDQITRIMNVFYDAVAPYMVTPRHAARFRNVIEFTWPAIANEISMADFIVLETLRLYEPELFRKIRAGKTMLCGHRGDRDRGGQGDARFAFFIQDVSSKNHEVAKLALMRLFPRMEEMGYGSEFVAMWDAERRVCVEKHFDTYFRMVLSEESLSTKAIEELVGRAADREFVQATMRNAAKVERRNGKSLVPVYLDELNTHARKVPKESVAALVSALFEIHDEIDLEKDTERRMVSIDTSLRFHWLIRRLTEDRFTIEERTKLYLEAIEDASLGWLVDFVSSARPRKDAARTENPLVEDSALPALTERALNAIHVAAADGSLLQHEDLLSILFRWRDFAGDSEGVRKWTGELLSQDEAIAVLARQMTGKSWSQGLGGFGSLGDRVSKANIHAYIDGIETIIDVDAFKKALARIDHEGKLDDGSLSGVRTFLRAWEKRINRDD